MSDRAAGSCDELLANFIHDLRQPLGMIAMSASYLRLVLKNADPKILMQLEDIESQVCQAERLAVEFRAKLPRYAGVLADSRERTNSATAGVK
jgi:signal transduction histidine kinase